MNLEVSKEDLVLLDIMLSKEISETRVEIHHSRSHDYTGYLEAREKQANVLLKRVRDALGVGES